MSRKPTKPQYDLGEPSIPGDGITEPSAAAAPGGDSGTADAAAIDPATIAGNGGADNLGGGTKRGRGRPRGSTNSRPSTASKPTDIGGIEKLLYGIHMMAAHIIAPEFGMPENECSELAKAIHSVNSHYGFKILDQKTADWFHLIQCVGVAYGSRVMAIRERKRSERKNNVTPIRPREVRTETGMHQPTPDRVVPPGFEGPDQNGARRVTIPGVTDIEFPADHPLSPKAN